MANPQVQADSARRNPVRKPDILELHMSGMTPFLSHGDAANERLGDAHAILQILSQAFEGAYEASQQEGSRETIALMNQRIVARALDGVASLIAYAQHHLDCVGRVS